jgi:hypothetical protein
VRNAVPWKERQMEKPKQRPQMAVAMDETVRALYGRLLSPKEGYTIS